MIEVQGNLWSYAADFRVITTNGSRRSDGRAVMGRGCAREAALRYPTLPLQLGRRLQRLGNRVHFFAEFNLFTFPVKHRWMDDADPSLIVDSVGQFSNQLLESCEYVMPRPGCGNGGLVWEDVRSLLAGLPDNVKVIDFPSVVTRA